MGSIVVSNAGSNNCSLIPPESPSHAASPNVSSVSCSCFSNLSSSINNSCVGRFYRRCVAYTPLVTDLTGVIVNIANAKTLSFLLNFVFDTTAASGGSWKGQEWLFKAVRDVKVLAAVTIPVALYSLGRDTYELVRGTEQVDAGLRVAENLSWLGDSTSTFISGLESTGAIHNGIAATTFFPISIASGCLATATIALNGRRLYQSRQLLKEMDAEPGDNEVLTLLTSKDEYFLQKSFNVEGEKLKETLQEIQGLAAKKLANGDAKASQNTLKTTVDSLKERIRTKNWSHRLSILSSIVTLVGMGILLFSPFGPIAYGLMAVAALVSVAKFLYERKSMRYFATTLNDIKTAAAA